MKKKIYISILAIKLCLVASAQSSCYEGLLNVSIKQYNEAKYAEAKKNLGIAKSCPDANITELDKWIAKCNSKMNSVNRKNSEPVKIDNRYFKYDLVQNFSEGMAAVIVYDFKSPKTVGDKLGYIDTTGKLAIPLIYDTDLSGEYYKFSEGLAAVSRNNLWGYIDKTGSIVIPFEFSHAEPFSGGLAHVRDNKEGLCFIDKQGRRVITKIYGYGVDPFFEGRAAVNLGGPDRGYIIDSAGKKVNNVRYLREISFPVRFSEGLAAVTDSISKLRGYIDKNGKTVIPFIYKEAYPFSEGVAMVKETNSDLYAFIDKSGRKVIAEKYEIVLEYDHLYEKINNGFKEGLIAVCNGNPITYTAKWGFIDKEGKTIIPFKYSGASSFSEGYAAIEIDHKWGFIDRAGRIIIPAVYDHVSPFSNGFSIVTKNHKMAVINRQGKYLELK